MSLAAGCGGATHHADEPTLASQARPLQEGSDVSGEIASACDRTVWSFRPASAGDYRFEARSDVPMSIRLFSTDPDLYVDTGRTEDGVARVEDVLHTDTTYAVTLAGTDCRPTSYTVSVTRAYVAVGE